MLRLDLTRIPFPDASFDVVLCSHVLEHVPADRQAMRELRRVLAPDGWALLLVPMGKGPTREDPSIVEPAARERAFGQWDHVRMYGPDFADRLREVGFAVTVVGRDDVATAEEQARMALTPATGDIYRCAPGPEAAR